MLAAWTKETTNSTQSRHLLTSSAPGANRNSTVDFLLRPRFLKFQAKFLELPFIRSVTCSLVWHSSVRRKISLSFLPSSLGLSRLLAVHWFPRRVSGTNTWMAPSKWNILLHSGLRVFIFHSTPSGGEVCMWRPQLKLQSTTNLWLTVTYSFRTSALQELPLR